MRRHHDMGGLPAGPVDLEPRAHAPWEKRVAALLNVLARGDRPVMTVDEMRRAIDGALRAADEGQGVLVLTDMFGGTPSNISLSFLEDRRVEVDFHVRVEGEKVTGFLIGSDGKRTEIRSGAFKEGKIEFVAEGDAGPVQVRGSLDERGSLIGTYTLAAATAVF